MTYEMYRYIFLGALAACGLFFVIAAILFFALNIPKVISDLTGRTAKKAIENIRMQNEQTGDKTYQSSAVNLKRGKLTDKISHSGRLIKREASPFGTGVITEKISTAKLVNPAGETDVLTASDETAVLGAAGETDVLIAPAGETEVLTSVAGETDVLTPVAAQTDVLTPAPQPAQIFTVECEITFVHTNEVIK